MAGSMSRADLRADLKASLLDAARLFPAANDGDFDRLLDTAARALGQRGRGLAQGELTLTAGVSRYTALPADFGYFQRDMWADTSLLPQPWEPTWPGKLPRVSTLRGPDGIALVFEPAPSAQHLALFGATFRFAYRPRLVIGSDAADTTVRESDRDLLMLRAQAEAMRELAMRAVHTPVQMRDGMSAQPRNATPAALFAVLLDEFEARVREEVPA
jgi:hypothetical protein